MSTFIGGKMNGIPIIVGVTGHRDIVTEDIADMKLKFRLFLDTLQDTYKNTEILVASGLARGADIYAVEAAMEVKDGKQYGYIGVLPMSREEYAKDFDDIQPYTFLGEVYASESDLFNHLCDHATFLQEGPFYIEKFEAPLRNLCYEAQGKRLADHADFLVAFLDERSDVIQGGTAHVVSIRKTGICNHRLNHSYLGEMVGGRSTFIIPVRRQSMPDIPAKKKQMDMMPVILEAEDMMSYDTFNKAMKSQVKEASLKRPEKKLEPSAEKIIDKIDRLYTRADTLSIGHGKRKKNQVLWMLFMLVAAITCFEFYGVIDWYGFLAIYIGLYLLLIFSYSVVLAKKSHHRQYVDYRMLAELVRVQYFWTLAGIKDQVVDHFSLKNRETVGWVRQAMRSIEAMIQADVQTLKTNRESLDFVVENWIKKQKIYYVTAQIKHKSAMRKKDRIYKIGFVLGFLMLMVVIYLSVVLNYHSNDALIAWLVSGSGLVTALSALYGDRIDMDSFEALTDRYKMMDTAFARAEEVINNIEGDEKRLQEVFVEIGNEVINEIGDWYYTQKSKEGKLS